MARQIRRILVLLALLALLPPLAGEILGWGIDASARAARVRSVEIKQGRTLHVVETGAGSPVVLVHGLPGSAADWAETPEQLARVGPHRVIAYDRIGYGYSSRAQQDPDGYSYTSNATELGELLDALEIERAALVGWSYGGGVVQTFALLHPERVSHLVLLGSVGPSLSTQPKNAFQWLMGSPAAVPVLLWVASIPPLSRSLSRASLAEAFAGEEEIPDGWVDYTRAMLALPGTLRTFATEGLRSDPAVLQPEKIATPTLVIHGADDYLVPFSVGEDLHRQIRGSKFFPVLSGSHMLPVTHPEVLSKQIAAFVRGS